MRRVILLLGAVLSLSVAATAKENAVTLAPVLPAAAAASPQGSSDSPGDWQLAFSYQYNRLRLGPNSHANTHGFNTSVVRFVGGHFGLEGDLGTGFGNTGSSGVPANLVVKTVFLGGGPHISFNRDSAFEPWVHGLIGLEHYRFTQTGTLGTSNAVAWTLGGGADLHFNPRTAFRVQGDYLGTRPNSSTQSNFQLIVGLVFNF